MAGGKTVVLRKSSHWYVLNTTESNEKEIILALIEHAEQDTFQVNTSEVYQLAESLGWTISAYIPGLGAA